MRHINDDLFIIYVCLSGIYECLAIFIIALQHQFARNFCLFYF